MKNRALTTRTALTLTLATALASLLGGVSSAQTVRVANQTVNLQALPLIAPASVPLRGSFYSLHGTNMPPLPFLRQQYGELSLPIYWLGGTRYLVEDTSLDWAAIEAERRLLQAAAAMSANSLSQLDGGVGLMGCGYGSNELWLEITNVANGLAFANLHNGTNQAYAIWATTNLTTPFNLWEVETELWPTNTSCQPFTALTLGRADLFLRAQDWTGVDSDNDGIPDWWVWYFFGDLAHTANDPACGSLLYYYTNGLDPNPLTAISLDVSLCAGTPRQISLKGWAWSRCYTPARGILFSILVPPQHGSLTGMPGPDGNYIYTPTNANFTGTDSFSYLASIAWGGNTVTGQVNLAVGDAYLCPSNQSAMTGTNQPVSLLLTASGWLGCSNFTFIITSGPTNGVLSGTPPNVVYSPSNHFEGEDHFSFTVSDGVWGPFCGDGTVTLYVVAGPTDFAGQCNTNGPGVWLSWGLDAVVQNLVQQGLAIIGFDIYRRGVPGSFTTNDIIFSGTNAAQTDYLDLTAVPNNTYNYVVAFAYRDSSTEILYRSALSAQAVITACCPTNVGNSLWVNAGPTPLELARWLMGTNPVVISNATYTGAAEARGIFGNGNGVGLNGHQFPIDHGVILASGNITNAIGPNNWSRASTPFAPGDGDADLDDLVGGGGTTDAAVLEFDLIATNAFTLRLEYVFASEEYPEYIGPYNDPMAIFVSTNYDGTKWVNSITNDLALVPGTTTPISVNYVNGGYTNGLSHVPPTNPQYYQDNHDPSFSAVPPYAASSPAYNLQYDGFTTLLAAQTNLVPAILYHVKICIADYKGNDEDHVYDSAVLLSTRSFPCH